MKKIVFINIFIFLLLLCFFELFFVLKNYYSKPIDYKFYDVPINSLYRSIKGENYTKKPVILFGCSIAYGYNLDSNQNFSSILSRETKRPVYNAAVTGYGPAHMLKLLKENRMLFNLKDPEYIIYTFIKDHKNRLFYYQGWKYDAHLYFRYVLDSNGELVPVERKYPFYWRFQIVRQIQYMIEKMNYSNEKVVDKLLFKIFEESVSVMKKRYPNAKLIMLLYDQKICRDNIEQPIFKTENILTKLEQEKLTELGFEIYNMEEIFGKSFCAVDYHSYHPNTEEIDPYHPSTKMWEEFVPKLVEKLNM